MTPLSASGGGVACPSPIIESERVLLGHGSGGKLSAMLLRDHILPRFTSAVLRDLGDAAVVPVIASELAVSTDAFVVNPLEFPGGDIGALAIHGTLNDLAMMGAAPSYITVSFILEEGLPIATLDRIVATMACAADREGVAIIAGDTKVVERGKADGMFITTTGIGMVDADFRPAPSRACAGDAVLVTGALGNHGITIMSVREGLGFETELSSDTASVYPLVKALRRATANDIHAMRDPTRGGVASALNEIAAIARVGIELSEESLPVDAPVVAACEVLGLDPLYVANEGIFLAFVPAPRVEHALSALRAHPLGARSRCIGHVVSDNPGTVWMRTTIGGRRVVDMLPGDQLPRIC
jgi:hydrogenase expression/formation protein HypE